MASSFVSCGPDGIGGIPHVNKGKGRDPQDPTRMPNRPVGNVLRFWRTPPAGDVLGQFFNGVFVPALGHDCEGEDLESPELVVAQSVPLPAGDDRDIAFGFVEPTLVNGRPAVVDLGGKLHIERCVYPEGQVGESQVVSDARHLAHEPCYGRRHGMASVRPGAALEKLSGFRLRKRGRLTREIAKAVQTSLVGTREAGGKTSLNAARLWREAISDFGAKVLRCDRVDLEQKDGELTSDHLLVLGYGKEQMFLSLTAYSRLFSYACFRPRTKTLLPSLRTRAAQEMKDLGHGREAIALLLPGTVSLAMHVLPWESSQFTNLSGPEGKESTRHSKRFDLGAVPDTLRYTFLGKPREVDITSRWHRLLGVLPRFHVRDGRDLPATAA